MRQKKMSQRQIKNLLCQVLPADYDKKDLLLVRRAKTEKGQEKLIAAYTKRELCLSAKVELMGTAPAVVVKDFISKNESFSDKEQIALVERKDLELISFFLNTRHFMYLRATLILLKWDNNELYPAMNGVLLYNKDDQRVFASSASFEFLFEHWDSLSVESMITFIKRVAFNKHDVKLVDKILLNKRLDPEIEAMLVKYCSDEALKLYISKHKLSDEAQVVLVKKRSTMMSVAYLYERPFTSSEAIKALARRPWQNELNMQIIRKDKANIPGKVQIAILRRGSGYLQEAILKNSLAPEAEIVLLKEGRKDVIKKYIDEHSLNFRTQRYLMKSKKHELISYFIEHKNLAEAAIFALIKKGSHAEIMEMLCAGTLVSTSFIGTSVCEPMNILPDYLAEALIKRGNKEEIQQYLKNQHPEISIP